MNLGAKIKLIGIVSSGDTYIRMLRNVSKIDYNNDLKVSVTFHSGIHEKVECWTGDTVEFEAEPETEMAEAFTSEASFETIFALLQRRNARLRREG